MAIKENDFGELYIVATPIGNLKDITLRALEVLKEVDVILAEDTRHSAHLLNHYEISKKLISFHKFNEKKKTSYVIDLLKKGQNIALISDAGTPMINDPGAYLVDNAHKDNIPVIPIPGPSSLTAALSASGIMDGNFIFGGFLPSQKSAKKKHLEEIRFEKKPYIVFDAPHRIKETLAIMSDVFEVDRQIVIAKELTKMNEKIVRGTIKEMEEWIKIGKHDKGEFVIIIEKNDGIDNKEHKAKETLELLLPLLPKREAINLTAKITNFNKNKIYSWAIEK